MNLREIVLSRLAAVVQEHSPLPFPDPAPDEMLLEYFWLDSIAFTSLLTTLEAEVGFIPSEVLKGLAFPETIGELIKMYEEEVDERA